MLETFHVTVCRNVVMSSPYSMFQMQINFVFCLKWKVWKEVLSLLELIDFLYDILQIGQLMVNILMLFALMFYSRESIYFVGK